MSRCYTIFWSKASLGSFSLPRLGWFYGFRNRLNMSCKSAITPEKLYHHDLGLLKTSPLLSYHKTSQQHFNLQFQCYIGFCETFLVFLGDFYRSCKRTKAAALCLSVLLSGPRTIKIIFLFSHIVSTEIRIFNVKYKDLLKMWHAVVIS